MRRGRLWRIVLGAAASAALALSVAPGTGSGADAAARLRAESAIFYYPWYSTPTRDGYWAHWYVHGSDGEPMLSTPYYPKRGLYSSSNTKVVAAHMREIAGAGIRTLIVSWWGFGSPEDSRLALVTSEAKRVGLRVAVHVEPYAGRTPETTAEAISQLAEQGYRDFYVYDADRDAPADWAVALADLDGVRVFAHTHLVGRAIAGGFDGLYTYDVVTWTGSTFARTCRQAHAAGLLCAPSVGPGFDARLATTVGSVRPRLHGATYDRMWRAALRAEPDVVTITSYNEWQEGTQIEPAQLKVDVLGDAPARGPSGYEGAWGKYGRSAERAYLDATARWTLEFRASFGQ